MPEPVAENLVNIAPDYRTYHKNVILGMMNPNRRVIDPHFIEGKRPERKQLLPIVDILPPEPEGPQPIPMPVEKKSVSPPPPPPPKPEPLPTKFVTAFVGEPERKLRNDLESVEQVGSLDEDRLNKDLRGRFSNFIFGFARLPLIRRIPVLGQIPGRIVSTALHPIGKGWQGGIFKDWFDNQRLRFVTDLNNTIKSTVDPTIPIDVSPDVIKEVVKGGEEKRAKLNILRRFVWALSDTVKGTIPLSQTSRQKLAREWLRERLQDQGFVRRLQNRVLYEENDAGERFSRLDGFSVEESNSTVISEEAGEKRVRLPEALQPQTNTDIKQLIFKYANGELGEGRAAEFELVKKVNEYIKNTLKSKLTPELQELLSTAEFASNILTTAHELTGRDRKGQMIPGKEGLWKRYLEQKAENGKTYWENVELDFLIGKARWGAIGGDVNVGMVTKVTARQLSDFANADKSKLGIKTGGFVWEVGKDTLAFGGGFAGGFLSGSLGFGTNLGVSTFTGGMLGMVGVGAVKESGFSLGSVHALGRDINLGFQGRYAREVAQMSREIARSRETPERAHVREQMLKAKLFVGSIDAQETSTSLQAIIEKENFNEADAKNLLTKVADLKARIRLTQLSGSAKLGFQTQNYIRYTDGYENEQYNLLTGLMLSGVRKLVAYSAEHKTFMEGARIFTGVSIKDGYTVENMGVFEKTVAIAEARLRVGSQAEKIKRWLKKELRLDDAAVQDWLVKYLPELVRDGYQLDQSLDQKRKNLRGVSFWKGVEAAASGAATVGAVAGLSATVPYFGQVYSFTSGGPFRVLSNFYQEVGQLVSHPLTYFDDWHKVLSGGNIPLVRDANGNLHSSLSPNQQLVLAARHIEDVFAAPTSHGETIDGVKFTLPGGVKFDSSSRVIIDQRNGAIIADLSDIKIDTANGQLILHDKNGGNIPGVNSSTEAEQFLKLRGIDIGVDTSVSSGTKDIDYLQISKLERDNVQLGSLKMDMNLPHGVIRDGNDTRWHGEWITNKNDSTKWDLVAVKDGDSTHTPLEFKDHQKVVFIEEAKFDSHGKMTEGHGVERTGYVTYGVQDGPPIIRQIVDRDLQEAVTKLATTGQTEINGHKYIVHNETDSLGRHVVTVTNTDGTSVVDPITQAKIFDTEFPLYFKDGKFFYETSRGNLVPASVTNFLHADRIITEDKFYGPERDEAAVKADLNGTGYRYRMIDEAKFIPQDPHGRLEHYGSGEAEHYNPSGWQTLLRVFREGQNYILPFEQYLRNSEIIDDKHVLVSDGTTIFIPVPEMMRDFKLLKQEFDSPGSVNATELATAKSHFGWDVTVAMSKERIHIEMDKNSFDATLLDRIVPHMITQEGLRLELKDLGQFIRPPQIITSYTDDQGAVWAMSIYGGPEIFEGKVGVVPTVDVEKTYIGEVNTLPLIKDQISNPPVYIAKVESKFDDMILATNYARERIESSTSPRITPTYTPWKGLTKSPVIPAKTIAASALPTDFVMPDDLKPLAKMTEELIQNGGGFTEFSKDLPIGVKNWLATKYIDGVPLSPELFFAIVQKKIDSTLATNLSEKEPKNLHEYIDQGLNMIKKGDQALTDADKRNFYLQAFKHFSDKQAAQKMGTSL